MKPSERIQEIKEGTLSYAVFKENGSTYSLFTAQINAIIEYLDEQAESQEPKALEEKPRWNTERSVRDIIRDEPAKPQEEPCKECHSRTGHARRCSMRREGTQEEPKLPQSDFRMNPEEVVKAGKDWWDLQKDTEPKEDPVQAERQRILDLPCMQEESEAKTDSVEDDSNTRSRNSLRREIRDALQSK